MYYASFKPYTAEILIYWNRVKFHKETRNFNFKFIFCVINIHVKTPKQKLKLMNLFPPRVSMKEESVVGTSKTNLLRF